MKLINAIRNFFVKKIAIAENVEDHEQDFQNETVNKPFDYGMNMLGIALNSGDYGWTDPVELPKKYILTDLECYKEKVSVFGLSSCWRETGHAEWEYLLAGIFVGSLLEAWENGAEVLDITKLFNRDLTAKNNRVFTKEQVTAHILPFFTKVTEDDSNIYLKLNVAA